MKNKGMKTSAIISGTFSLTLSTVIVKLLGLIYKIPLAAILGDEGMGYFNSAYAVYSFFFLLCTAGVPKAVMILVSKSNTEGKNEESEHLVSSAARLFLIIGLILFIIFSAFSIPISKLIGNSKAWTTMLAVAPSIIFISLSSVIRGYLSANMRLLEIAVSQVIEGVGKLAVGLIAAQLSANANMPPEMISAMTILGVSFGALVGMVYLFIVSKIKITKHKTRQKSTIGPIFKISLPITVSAGIMSLTGIIDLGLIMRSLESIGYTELEATALYGNYTTLAVPIFNLAIAIITPISIAFLPIFTSSIASKNFTQLNEAEESSIKLTSLLTAPMTVGLIAFSNEILTLLFPKSEIEIGAMLLCLLAPATVFFSLLLIVNNSLEAGGRVRAPLISMSIGCIVKITVSLLLIKNPSFGISGAPIGTVLSYCTALIISLIIYRIEYGRNIHINTGLSRSFVFAILSVLVSKSVFKFLLSRFSQNVALLIAIFLCAILYFGIYLSFELISSRGQLKIAKYTNFSLSNCKLNT